MVYRQQLRPSIDLASGGVPAALQILEDLEYPNLDGGLRKEDENIREPLEELFERIVLCFNELKISPGAAASVAGKLQQVLAEYDELDIEVPPTDVDPSFKYDEAFEVFSDVEHAIECLIPETEQSDEDTDTGSRESKKVPQTFHSMVRIDESKNTLPPIFLEKDRALRPFIGHKDDRSAIEFLQQFERFLMRNGLLYNSNHTFIECLGLSLGHQLQEHFFTSIARLDTYQSACENFISLYTY